jgi:hypothetical protein
MAKTKRTRITNDVENITHIGSRIYELPSALETSTISIKTKMRLKKGQKDKQRSTIYYTEN